MAKPTNASHSEKFVTNAIKNGDAVFTTASGVPVALGKGTHDWAKAIETTPIQKP